MEPQHQLATVENAAAIYQRMPDPIAAIKEMGQMFAGSGMFGCSKVEQGQVLALACLIEGKSPFELMRNYHIIGGSLSMRSVAVLANFMGKGGTCVWHSALNNTDEAQATFKIGNNELINATYSIKDAEREGLISGPNKHNWTARPADMLRARLITKAVRMIAPGIIMGVADETEAIPVQAPPLLGHPAATEPAPGALPDTAQPGLEDLLARDGIPIEKAIAFCVHKDILKEGQTFADLTTTASRKIMKKFDDFVKAVQEFIAAPPTA